MVKPPKITSPAVFEAWLEGKPGGLASILANRNALRLAPLGLAEALQLDKGLSHRLTLAVWRATAIARYRGAYWDQETAEEAMRLAAHFADSAVNEARALDNFGLLKVAVFAAYCSAYAAFFADHDGSGSARNAHAAVVHVRGSAVAGFFEALEKDCRWFDDNAGGSAGLRSGGLWPVRSLREIERAWTAIQNHPEAKRQWSEWHRWYDRRLKGRKTEWGLDARGEREMARRLIEADEAFWKRGEEDPAYVNAQLAAWRKELTPGRKRDQRVDFFISHAAEQEVWAAEIERVLQSAGYSTLRMKDFGPGDFVTEMDRGLLKMRHFVPIYSKAYVESAHCRKEWNYAYSRDPDGAKWLTRAFLIETCDLQPLATTLVYQSLIGIGSASERQALILDWATRQRSRFTRRQKVAGAAATVSPEPSVSPADQITTVPNRAFDQPLPIPDLFEPVDILKGLARLCYESLHGNRFPQDFGLDLGAYRKEIEANGRHSNWGLLEYLRRALAATLDNAITNPYYEVTPSLESKLRGLFAEHDKCMTGLARADERALLFWATRIKINEARAALEALVGALKHALDILCEAGRAEPSFDAVMEQLISSGRRLDKPPEGEAGAMALRRWTYNTLGVSAHPLIRRASAPSAV